MITPIQMKRAYEEHRKVEEARDLDAVVATFADNCSYSTSQAFVRRLVFELRAF